MEQLQTLFSYIPNSILNWLYWLIIVLGISGIFAGWLGRWIPMYGKYVQYLKPIGVVVLVLGVWLRGGYDTEMAWRAKVAEMEEKVAKSEELSKQANNDIQVKVVTKTKIVREQGLVIKQYLDREVVKDREVIKFVESCPIPTKIIEVHNAAATNTPVEVKR